MFDLFYKEYVAALAIGAFTFVIYALYNGETRKLRHIPTIGIGWPILSYFSAIKFMMNGHAMVQEGYDKHKGGAFKIPYPNRWLVVLSGREHFEELKRAPDEYLSALFGIDEHLQATHTMGKEVVENPYHIPIVGRQLTRNLGVLFPHIQDELISAFTDYIPPSEEWVKYSIMDTLLPVICRTTNRVLIGQPLCRDPELIKIGINYTTEVVTVSTILNLLPSFMHSIVAFILTKGSRNLKRTMELIAPVVAERKEMHKNSASGFSGAETPNFLTWLLEDAKEEQGLEILTRRILALEFSAIHTTTLTFLQVLYNVAAFQEYVKPLREEVDAVVSQEGWTKAALDKMKKVDSFIRETQRVYPLGSTSSFRLVMKDYTFRNGTFLPKGTMLTIPTEPLHIDAANYPDADRFDGFRFANVPEDGNRRLEIVSITNEFSSFGIGKHACPGRFFVSGELKLLLAYVLHNYDVKFENEGVRPDDLMIGSARIPNPKAEVMFRKRTNV